MTKLPYKEILKTIGIFILGFIIILVVAKTTNKIIGTDQQETPVRPIVECPADFKSYEKAKERKNVVVLEKSSSYGVDGSFSGHDYRVSLKRTGLKSQIACGYLFYRTSVGERALDQEHENLYMAPVKDSQFGGHVIPDEKETIRNQEINNKTEILLPLDSITYDGTSRKNIYVADWGALLNVSDRIDFNIALNSIDPAGKIDAVEIAYKCWNPKTGEETDDCNLEVIR